MAFEDFTYASYLLAVEADFENGIVLVNPTMEADRPPKLEQAYLDPRTGQKVSSVKMGPHTGTILLADR